MRKELAGVDAAVKQAKESYESQRKAALASF